MGQILLPIKIEDAEHFTSTWMNFVVVRSPSPYNGIIGRPEVMKIQAVPSTAHGMLKFPVLGEILTLQSSRIIPLECTMVSGSEAQPSSITQAAKERIRVAIHPEHPEQTIAIGSTLTEEGRKALSEHRLNFREGCLPVRKKKRSQAPKRNKAIQEEVAKLIDARIMKEVHYHSWLSNPVMKWSIELGEYDIQYRFDATNNEAVYEALIAGLRITEQMGIQNLQTNVDSRLVANQVNGSYIAKESGMVQYLEKVKALASSFKKFSIK
ncbi:reverse transcriptase domain-containing protein [Tanacetum coccineum]